MNWKDVFKTLVSIVMGLVFVLIVWLLALEISTMMLASTKCASFGATVVGIYFLARFFVNQLRRLDE